MEVDKITLSTSTLRVMSVPEGEDLRDNLIAHQNKCVNKVNTLNVSPLSPIAKLYAQKTGKTKETNTRI